MATREQQNIRNQVAKNMSPFSGNQDATNWNDALQRPIKNRDYYNSKQLEIEKGGGGLSVNWKNYDNGQSLIDRWFFSSGFGVTERRLNDYAGEIRNRIAKISSWRETKGFTNPVNYYELVYMESSSNWEALNNTNWNVPLAKIWKKKRNEEIEKMKEQQIIEKQNRLIQEELILQLELENQKKVTMEKQKIVADEIKKQEVIISKFEIIPKPEITAGFSLLTLGILGVLLLNSSGDKS